MSAVISQKKGWVVTQEAFERMLAELHPDVERAGEEDEKIRRKLIQPSLLRRIAEGTRSSWLMRR